MTAPRLVLFFTRGMSLEVWQHEGRLERELRLYDALARRLESVSMLTYGNDDHAHLRQRLDPIAILPNRWGMHSNWYSVLAPILHRDALRRATVLKTNQLNGAWCAAIAKRLWGTPLIVRCGFMWSDFYARETPSAWKRRAARAVERWTLRSADRIVVATEADRQYIIAQHGLSAEAIRVIPNYVDTEHFRPHPEVAAEPGRLCYVGKFGHNKNLSALLEAVRRLPGVRLRLIGEGPLSEALREQARRDQIAVEFAGTIPNERLPEALAGAQAFVFPSLYEGHPKALLEAMACGLPAIGTDAPGIRDIIRHRQTGYLCGTSAEALEAAIRDLLGDAPLRAELVRAARAYIQDTCSVDRIVAEELDVLTAVTAGRAG
jgi:glycosyltransferase involved in cell wall biosynthesis